MQAGGCTSCGVDGHVLEVGALVDGRYVITRPLGRGGQGSVFVAHDELLERSVALKVAPCLSSPRSPSHDGSQLEVVRREALALASVAHGHVARVFDVGQHVGTPYITMELVVGASLADMLEETREREQLLPIRRALQIVLDVADALDAVHAVGLLHRDVKPGNILVERRTGRTVLVDFGLAVAVGSTDGAPEGTPEYMAPEQFAADAVVGPTCDVYALACSAFELLTGKLPYRARDVSLLREAHETRPVPRLSVGRPELAPLDAVLEHAMAKTPASRFASAGQMAGALRRAAASWLSPVEPPESLDPETVSVGRARNERPVRVLVVDDDPTFVRFATRAVEIAFLGALVEISRAPSGLRAIASVRRKTPDLVLLDYNLPGGDGVETLSLLRAETHGGAVPVIVVSAEVGPDERARFALHGVTDIVAKPIQLLDLVERIAEVARATGLLDSDRSRPADD